MDILIQLFEKQHIKNPEATEQEKIERIDWISKIAIQTMAAQKDTKTMLQLDPGCATGHYMASKGDTIDHRKYTAGLREMADNIEAEYTEKEGKENE